MKSKGSKCVELTLQSMIPCHSKTQNDGWNWFLNVFDMFYFVFTCYDLFRALSKYFNSIFANASRIEPFQWWKHAKRWVFQACSIVSICKSSLNPCGGWQEGVVDMDYGVLVWVAGVGMRPFTRALCEKIGKVGALTLTVWQRRMEWDIKGLDMIKSCKQTR